MRLKNLEKGEPGFKEYYRIVYLYKIEPSEKREPTEEREPGEEVTWRS